MPISFVPSIERDGFFLILVVCCGATSLRHLGVSLLFDEVLIVMLVMAQNVLGIRSDLVVLGHGYLIGIDLGFRVHQGFIWLLF